MCAVVAALPVPTVLDALLPFRDKGFPDDMDAVTTVSVQRVIPGVQKFNLNDTNHRLLVGFPAVVPGGRRKHFMSLPVVVCGDDISIHGRSDIHKHLRGFFSG